MDNFKVTEAVAYIAFRVCCWLFFFCFKLGTRHMCVHTHRYMQCLEPRDLCLEWWVQMPKP